MIKLLRRTLHYAAYALAGVVIVLSSIALVLRVWIMPDIDRYRPQLARLIGQATGVPAQIGGLHAGWHGLSPRLSIDDLRLGSPGELPALTLPRVEATVSWASVLLFDLRLSSIELDRPHLVIHRDKQRVIRVAGIPVNTPGSSSPFLDWLLKQRMTVVRQATLVWQDDLLEAPPLTLSDLNLVLLNRLGRHRLGLTARPPDSVARWLDVRADVRGRSIERLEDFSGRLFVHAEGAAAAALGTWAPWAIASVSSGMGALRFWLDFSKRRLDGVVGDVRLLNVGIGPTDALPEIRFARIDGRVGWRRTEQGQDYFVERLSFTSPSGRKAAPASVRVRVADRADGKLGDLRVEAEALRLEALTALIGAVPIPRQAHDLIEAHDPRGHVDRLRLDWRDRDHYTLEARFREVGLRAGNGVPGMTGLSGEVSASNRGGQARIDSHRFTLDDAQVFRHPLAFDRAMAKLAWQARADGGYAFELKDLRLINADLDATGGGSVLIRPGSAPEVDLTARLSHAAGNAVWRYLPRSVSDDAYAWIRRGIRAGISDEARLILRGPLDRFPFHEGGGQFRVDVKVRAAQVEVAPSWPRFIGVNGWLVFHDTAMEILVDSAQVEGVPGIQLSGIKGQVPDLHFSDAEILHIEGRARGATAAFLDYIRASPVYDYTDRFTEHMRAQGLGELFLRLDLPLRHIDDSTVAGVFRVVDNRLDPGREMPVLERLTGDLSFTHREIDAKGLSAQLLGQPATLGIQSGPGGRVTLTVDGRMDHRGLATWVPEPLLRRLQGTTGYRAEIVLRQQHTDLRIESDLIGMAIDLPEPLGKPAERPEPLLVIYGSNEAGQTTILASYGQRLSARALLGKPGESPSISVLIGRGEARAPRNPGLTLEAAQDRLNLDAWLNLANEQGGGDLRINTVTLTANELILFDRLFTGTQVTARPDGRGWQLQVSGRELQGDVSWQPADGHPTLQGRFRRLSIPASVSGATTAQRPDRNWLIEADVRADSFLIADRDLGALELIARPDPLGLRLKTLRLTNPDGRLEADGLISGHARRDSRVNLRLESGNLSGLLGRLGYPGNIRRGEGSVSGRVGWQGGLNDFALEKLSGDLDVKLKKGQFTKLDPGAGRLLGVLSLQALPRRINLDFRDIFTEGFAFDEIAGPIHLERGIAQITDFNMRGPAASIGMKGEIDLARETQNLRVSVQPRLEDTLAAGAMLVNPAVGIGTLVASRVLKDPISKAATFEYMVRGSWAEPEVSRIPRARAADDGAANVTP
ncbi:MAG: YhdP family protein [Thiobacillaceae bacterium]